MSDTDTTAAATATATASTSSESALASESASTSTSTSTSTAVAPAPGTVQRERSHSKHDIVALAPEQRQKLDELERLITEQAPDDKFSQYTHLRFLRARKFDVPAALAMYMKFLKWRKSSNIDDILVNPPTDVRKVLSALVPESYHKFDRFGLPAYFMKVGHVHLSLLGKYMTPDEMIRSHLWGMEYSFQRAAESSARNGRNIDQFVNIVDLQGLSMSHRALIPYMQRIAQFDQEYYPEAMGKTYVINAPWIFPALWKIIKSFIDPVTRDKVHVLGSDYQKVLLERFDADQLPKEYGGTCTCGAAGCVPTFTEQQALQVIEEFESRLEWTEIPIAVGKEHAVTFETGTWGGTLLYSFKAQKNDVGFTATFTPAPNTMRRVLDATTGAVTTTSEPVQARVLHAHQRYSSGTPGKGTFAVDYPGVLTLTWDTKHSYWSGSELKLHTKFTPGVDGVIKEVQLDTLDTSELNQIADSGSSSA